MSSLNKVIKILLVEDDSLDRVAVKRTLDKKNILYQLTIAGNGEEAIQLLLDDDCDVCPGNPDLILLDLNMPRMNGFEFLKYVRNNERFQHIKVFILTTSERREDKIEAEKLGVSGFITKPLLFESPYSIDSFNLMIDILNLQN